MPDERSPGFGDLDNIPLETKRTVSTKADSLDDFVSVSSSGSSPSQSSSVQGPSAMPWMMATAVLIALLMVLSVWFYRQLEDLQSKVSVSLTDSTSQLDNLASQLSAVDESSTQSAQQVDDMLKLHDSEIRKLWGVSNDRNKKAIEENKVAIGKVQKSTAQVEKSTAAIKTSINALQTELDAEMKALNSSLEKFEVTRKQLQAQLGVLSETIQQVEARTGSQQKVLDRLTAMESDLQALVSLQNISGGVDARLTEIDSAISAFDNYRRQVNVRLDKLEAGKAP